MLTTQSFRDQKGYETVTTDRERRRSPSFHNLYSIPTVSLFSKSGDGKRRETERNKKSSFQNCCEQQEKVEKREKITALHLVLRCIFCVVLYPNGDVAQMVERVLSMHEVRGSMPRISIFFFSFSTQDATTTSEGSENPTLFFIHTEKEVRFLGLVFYYY